MKIRLLGGKGVCGERVYETRGDKTEWRAIGEEHDAASLLTPPVRAEGRVWGGGGSGLTYKHGSGVLVPLVLVDMSIEDG